MCHKLSLIWNDSTHKAPINKKYFKKNNGIKRKMTLGHKWQQQSEKKVEKKTRKNWFRGSRLLSLNLTRHSQQSGVEGCEAQHWSPAATCLALQLSWQRHRDVLELTEAAGCNLSHLRKKPVQTLEQTQADLMLRLIAEVSPGIRRREGSRASSLIRSTLC